MKFTGLRVWVNGATGRTPQVFPRIKDSLALASWCAMTGGMRKIGWGVFRSIPLWGSNSRCPVDKKARRMDPHSISMETHHACYRRLSDYHQPQPRQLRGPDPLT